MPLLELMPSNGLDRNIKDRIGISKQRFNSPARLLKQQCAKAAVKERFRGLMIFKIFEYIFQTSSLLQL